MASAGASRSTEAASASAGAGPTSPSRRADGRRIAGEVEIAAKRSSRLRAILRGFERAPHYDAVRFVVARGAVAERIARIAREACGGDRELFPGPATRFELQALAGSVDRERIEAAARALAALQEVVRVERSRGHSRCGCGTRGRARLARRLAGRERVGRGTEAVGTERPAARLRAGAHGVRRRNRRATRGPRRRDPDRRWDRDRRAPTEASPSLDLGRPCRSARLHDPSSPRFQRRRRRRLAGASPPPPPLPKPPRFSPGPGTPGGRSPGPSLPLWLPLVGLGAAGWKLWRDRRDTLRGGEARARVELAQGPLQCLSRALARRQAERVPVRP